MPTELVSFTEECVICGEHCETFEICHFMPKLTKYQSIADLYFSLPPNIKYVGRCKSASLASERERMGMQSHFVHGARVCIIHCSW